MENRYHIRNWAKYQHYKERNPSWIKLHAELLSSRDWVMLSDASRVLAIVCMLLAAKDGVDGTVPDDPEFIERVAYLNETPDFAPLIKCGFLEDLSVGQADASAMQADASIVFTVKHNDNASAMQADASTSHTNARPETETETETETEESERQINTPAHEDTVQAPKTKKTQKDIIDRIRDTWTDTAIETGLPDIAKMTKQRKAAIMARVKDYSLEDVIKVLEAPRTSAFLSGATGWTASFDWLLKPTNFAKTLEGNYVDREAVQQVVKPKISATQKAGATPSQAPQDVPWDIADVEKYGKDTNLHPRWDEYMDWCYYHRATGEQWPRFEEWMVMYE